MLKRVSTILIILLSFSAALAGPDQYFQYIYPMPDSKYISTETTLIFRFNEKWQNVINPSLLAIDVKGQKSGVHPGKIIHADDQKTIIFKPFQKFALYETVFVEIDINLNEEIGKVKYTRNLW
jgi:hypothetical protein